MNLIAIDPGASGGIAFLIGNQVRCYRMPGTQPDVLELIRNHAVADTTCYIEQLPLYAFNYGGADIPGSTIGVMFENFGFILGCLQTLGIRTIKVTPQKWQKELGLGTKGLQKAPKGASEAERAAVKRSNAQAKAEWKRKLRGEAQRRYPALAATLATADALLILEYGKIAENYREVEQNTPFALKG